MPSDDWEHLAYGHHPDKMTELSFAKAFLTTLDNKPVKVQSDYAVDLRNFEPQGPYTLPRMHQPMRKPVQQAAPGATKAIKITLKSLKNPPLDITLPSQPTTTSVLDLKQKVAEETGLAGTDKIRLLFKKKPCQDSKTLKDLVGEEQTVEAEFSVMVIGGMPTKAAANPDVKMEDAPVAQGDSGVTVMRSDEFWQDLEGFLLQRVRDQEVAEKAAKIFHEAWKQQG